MGAWPTHCGEGTLSVLIRGRMRETRREGVMALSGPVCDAAGALDERRVGVMAANAYTMPLKAFLLGVGGLLADLMRPSSLPRPSCLFVCGEGLSAAADCAADMRLGCVSGASAAAALPSTLTSQVASSDVPACAQLSGSITGDAATWASVQLHGAYLVLLASRCR